MRTIKERFFAKCFPWEDFSECWRWIGSTTGSGYGQMQFEGRKQMAHRVSYQIFVGPIPEGMTIDHKCQRKLCVNFKHLHPMPMIDNCRLGGLAQNTVCPKGHLFKGNNVIWIRDAKERISRMCRLCKQEKDRQYHCKNRERINDRKREAWRKAAGK